MTPWTSYWRNSHALSSFAEGDAAFGYPDELLKQWHQLWSVLPAKANLLDVGTGNGALAVALAEQSHSQGNNWQVTGIDLADIQPTTDLNLSHRLTTRLRQITFLGNCSVEQTPFDDQQFDAVFSQFGLEYADWASSLPELHRITKPSGSVVAFLHHSESGLSKDCELGAQILTHCLQQSPLMRLAEQLLERSEQLLSSAQSITTDSVFQQLNQALLAEVKSLQQDYGSEQAVIWFQDVLSRLVPLVHQLQSGNLQRFHLSFAQLELHRQRLLDQQRATIDASKSEMILGIAQQCGWQGRIRTIEVYSEPFALCLALYK